MTGRWRVIRACALVLVLAGCASAPGSPASLSSPSPTAPGDWPAAPIGPTQRAHVTRITDGDTIRVTIDGVEYRVRYIGMDTPESVKPGTPVQPYAKAATAANARSVEGRDVILEKDVSETDQYDRLLRYVWVEQPDGLLRMVNEMLVEDGYAHVLTYPPDVRYADVFLEAEQAARQAGRGLWAPASASP